MRVAITGGRNVTPSDNTAIWFAAKLAEFGVKLLITGGCPTGVDEWGRRIAQHLGIQVCVFLAPWDVFGDIAGPWRNAGMARLGLADVLLAFPGGRGTRSCIREFERCGIQVVRVIA